MLLCIAPTIGSGSKTPGNSPNGRKTRNTVRLVVVIVIPLVAAFVLLSGAFFWLQRRRVSKRIVKRAPSELYHYEITSLKSN